MMVSTQARTSSSTQTSPQAHNTAPALTAGQEDAQKHYKTASLAIKDGDFDIALKELGQAAQLDPRNSLIWYNLAVVQSIKGMTPAALDSLDQALKVGLPANLRGSAENLKEKLADEWEKRKQNPKILLAQQLHLWSEPEYAAILSDQRDLFLTTIAPILGPKENIFYAKQEALGNEALGKYYQQLNGSAEAKDCEDRAHADLDAQHPDWKNANYDHLHRLSAGPERESQFSNYDEFASFTVMRKCVGDINRDHAAEMSSLLRDLDYDAFVYITSNYRWTWKRALDFPDIDENWVDMKLELITAEGKYSSSPLTINVGHGFAGTEPLGKDPNLMFSRVAQDMRIPLVQLMNSADFK